jgi:hypothetical protein
VLAGLHDVLRDQAGQGTGVDCLHAVGLRLHGVDVGHQGPILVLVDGVWGIEAMLTALGSRIGGREDRRVRALDGGKGPAEGDGDEVSLVDQ